MRESPRIRRLRTDLRSMEQLRSDSTIVEFSVPGKMYGGPPEAYLVRFLGKGLWRESNQGRILVREKHEVSIQLGAAYPRMMPELSWRTPIFHPNISSSGVVCLGGYGTHWVPSLNLDELCTMLWDMVRYQNYDVESPYNREAALWAKSQQETRLPVDPRPIRDRVAGHAAPPGPRKPPIAGPPVPAAAPPAEEPDVLYIDHVEVVEASVVTPEDPDILFIDSRWIREAGLRSGSGTRLSIR